MIRLLILLVIAFPAVAGGITFADVCTPAKFVQTNVGLEVYCQTTGKPWLTITSCARPASVRVTKASFCAGTKYTVDCAPGKVAESGPIEVENEDTVLACNEEAL